jgi:hypothetical protein
MTPELLALAIVLWAWFIGLMLAPYLGKQLGPDSWPGRAFAALARLIERGWDALMGRKP